MCRTFLFIVLSGLANLAQAAVGDLDNDGRCAGGADIPGVCISNPPDTDDNNPDVNNDGICDGIRSVAGNASVRGCMQAPYAGSDADSDGIPDELESGDKDGDRIPDYLDRDTPNTGFGDSDSDGIDDKLECGVEVLPCLNTDGDGAFDYLDPDSDNDGVTDSEEADHLATNLVVAKPLDTDGDGLPDYRDDDSDADGRSDARESPTSEDQDLDGIPDVYDFDDRDDDSGQGGDSDRDGLSDKSECPVFPTDCPDSDVPPDGKPDYLDNNLDSDDDGIPDTAEDLNPDGDKNPDTQPTDTDQDGDADYRDGDSDNDGLLDKDERNNPFNSGARLDTDKDGIPDVVDSDGRLNQNGEGGDSDSDGVSDKKECPAWPACPDTDGDGIFDYLDADSFPPKPDLGVVDTGVDGLGSTWWLMLLLPLLAISGRAQALADKNGGEESVVPDLYAAVSLGRSQLEPSVAGSLYKLDERGDWAYKVSGGWDYNQYFSLEGYYAQLGDAHLKPEGKINYSVMGASVVGNYWLLGGERLPWSLALLGRAGVNYMSTDGRDVSLNQKNQLQLAFGTGLELYFDHNFSVRLEVESYDSDAALLSLGLVKRFGLQQRLVYAIPQGDSLAMVSDLPASSAGIRRAIVEPVVVDADNDGLLDDEDACLNTPPYSSQFQVDEQGCAPFQGVISGVNFLSSSERLTAAGQQRLGEIIPLLAEQLKNHENTRLQIRAHTDSQGRAGYNKQLSQRRANTIVKQILAAGVDSAQLDARGMGESDPRADNGTAAGRELNRRVEFILIVKQNER